MFKRILRSAPVLSVGQLLFILFGLSLIGGMFLLLLIANPIKERTINDIAQNEARQLSDMVFQSLYSAMSKGWSKNDIQEIIKTLNDNDQDVFVQVFRGAPVIRQFGEIPGEASIVKNDPVLERALADGRERFLTEKGNVRYIHPVKVSRVCLSCHTEAKVGEINGVIDMTIPIARIKESLNFVFNTVISSFIIIITLIFIALFYLMRFFMARPIVRLEEIMQDVIQDTDLSKRLPMKAGWVKEVDSLSKYFNKMLTTLEDYNLQLEDLSIRDPLTKLFNRRKFEQILENEIRRSRRSGRPFCLIMLDMDNFKHINDTYGHPIGDMALKDLSRVLENNTRKTDIVSRIGGDEFAIILPDTNHAHGLRFAKKLCEALSSSDLELPSGKIRMTASFGIVEYPDNGETLEDLSISMDVAMYKAKRKGKNRVAVIEGLDKEMVAETYTMGESTRKALDEDRLEVFLQPIIDLVSGDVLAYEALARIREADRVIAAGQFIDAAVDMGFGRRIDTRVIERALQQKKVHANINGAKLFFNISSNTFCDYDFMRRVPTMLNDNGLTPSDVVFEITEREALPHISELSALIEELSGQGISFALDDFGSGFSSFIYLKYLPVDYIKIEGSFIQHISSDKSDRIMVEHIMGMAHDFGLRVIGEGVEDRLTHDILANMGMDFAQGFFYAKPAPFKDASRLVSIEK